MTTTRNELKQLISQLPIADREVIELACLMHLSASCMTRLSQEHSTDLSALMNLGERCIAAYSEARGIDPVLVRDALQALRRAQVTVRYLDSLPD